MRGLSSVRHVYQDVAVNTQKLSLPFLLKVKKLLLETVGAELLLYYTVHRRPAVLKVTTTDSMIWTCLNSSNDTCHLKGHKIIMFSQHMWRFKIQSGRNTVDQMQLSQFHSSCLFFAILNSIKIQK